MIIFRILYVGYFVIFVILQVMCYLSFIPRIQVLFQSYEKIKLMGSCIKNQNMIRFYTFVDAEGFVSLRYLLHMLLKV